MKSITLLLGASLLLNACKKHEIIPAPTPKVSLKVHFKGIINGTLTEYTQNVESMIGSTKQGIVLPVAPLLSTATYFSTMGNGTKSISLGLGELAWDQSVSASPLLAQFSAFFNTNISPAYASETTPGFIVTWSAVVTSPITGAPPETRVYVSKQTPYHLDQDVDFTKIVQESDTDGDYSKFRANFNTFVYRSYRVEILPATNPKTYDTLTDSLHIVDGVYDGWFKLQK